MLKSCLLFFFPVFISILVGCAKAPLNSNLITKKEAVSEDDGTVVRRPQWINDPFTVCSDEGEICAVGESTGEMMAEAHARRALAQIFQTKVVGTQKVTKNSEQKQDEDGVVSGTVDESSFSEVQEVTDEVLKGVVIKQRFSDKDGVYALASLDKREASQQVKREMELLDEQMQELYKNKNGNPYRKLKRMYQLREILNLRYQFLSGHLLPQVLSHESLSTRKIERDQAPVIYFPEGKDPSLQDLKPLIVKLLTDQDFSVVNDEEKKGNASYHLSGKVISQELFMKVEGFKKYDFQLDLIIANLKGEKVQSLEQKVSAVGRTFDQAYQQALGEMRKFLQEKIPEIEWP